MNHFVKIWMPVILLTAGVIVCTVVVAERYLGQPAQQAVSCTKTGTAYTIAIIGGKPTPDHVDGKRCDTLTFLNKDTKLRLFAFGDYNNHIAYDGVTEQVLAEDQSMTITLVKTGTYKFHDHLEPSVAGTFTVTP